MLYLYLACGVSAIQDAWTKNGVETIKDGYVSAFLIQSDSGESILIDTGGDKNAKAIKVRLSEKNLTTTDVKHILFTHAHTDHIAGTSVFTHAQHYAIAQEQERIASEIDIDFSNRLQDGQNITLGGIDILPLHVPGHTQGNAVYVINKVLIMGDTAMASKKGEVIPSPDIFNEDDEASKKAISELYKRITEENIEIDWIAFSHSGPLRGLEALSNYTY